LHLVNDAQGILFPHLRSQQEKNDIEFLKDGMPLANGLMKSMMRDASPMKKDFEDKLKLSQQVQVLPPAPVQNQ